MDFRKSSEPSGSGTKDPQSDGSNHLSGPFSDRKKTQRLRYGGTGQVAVDVRVKLSFECPAVIGLYIADDVFRDIPLMNEWKYGEKLGCRVGP